MAKCYGKLYGLSKVLKKRYWTAFPICQRRETVRRPLGAVTGRLSAEGQPECICELIDFSPKGGMKIKANIELKPGAAVTLESDITGRQQATMVWRDDECMGIKFAA